MTTTEYDPSGYTNQEVLDYLAGADPDEVQRVLALEAGEGGRQRVGILREHGALPEQDTVEVELLHHWTDAEGTSHSPGAKVNVPHTVAEQLVNARFGNSDAIAPQPIPGSTTDTGMVSAEAAAAADAGNVGDTGGPTV